MIDNARVCPAADLGTADLGFEPVAVLSLLKPAPYDKPYIHVARDIYLTAQQRAKHMPQRMQQEQQRRQQRQGNQRERKQQQQQNAAGDNEGYQSKVCA